MSNNVRCAAGAQFDTVVTTLVFCSVQDQERGLHEIWRVLKPGGVLLLLEHVRAQGRVVAWVQDALVPLSTRCMGNEQDFSWIHIPGVANEHGQPGEQQGLRSTPGLFFLGFPWQPSRGSALVGWVGKDARRLAVRLQIKEHLLSQVGGYS